VFNFGVLLLLFVCAVIIIDVVLRHPSLALRFYYGPDHYYYERSPFIPKLQRHTPKVDLYAGVVSDLNYISGRMWKEGKCHYVTDCYGYRNLVETPPPFPGTVILGNSFINAPKSDQSMILSSQLNRMGFCCYNIGVNAINLWEEMVNLKHQFKVNPQLSGVKQVVWAIFEGNALDGDFHEQTEPDELLATPAKQFSVNLENYYKRSVFRRLYKMLFVKRPVRNDVLFCDLDGREMLFYEPYVQKLHLDEKHVRSHEKMAAVEGIFTDMADFAKEHDLEVICVFIPIKSRVYEWVLKQESPGGFDVSLSSVATVMNEFSGQHGFAFLDLTPILSSEAKRLYAEGGQLIYWHDDTHWNDVGIGISAAAIAQALSVCC